MLYWIALILYILVGLYDLYLYTITKVLTITQRVHIYAKKCPILIRIIVTFWLLALSWYFGGIQLFIPALSYWLLCHLIGWDF